MHKLGKIFFWLLTKYAHRFFKGKKVYVFAGVRRSGNHACISWINNSIAQADTEFVQVGTQAYWSEKSGVLHLNEINFHGRLQYILFLRRNKHHIRNANIIFLTLEDYFPNQKFDLYCSKKATYIYITRGVLSTIASRIAYNIKQAKDGIDRGDVQVDENLLETIRKLRQSDDPWIFELWVSQKSWRKSYLSNHGLSDDISPQMTNHGGGSTFHQKNKKAAEAMSDQDRWLFIDWPYRVKKLLKKNEDLLTVEEKNFVESWGQIDDT